jgi:glycerol-3-phosphate O-acyltransferase
MKYEDMTKFFFSQLKDLMENSKMNVDKVVTPENVYQEAYTANRSKFLDIMRNLHYEGSTILGVENLIKMDELAKEGKSILILSEHVSNLDVPSMYLRFYDYPDDRLKDIFEKIIFVAGVKLNQNTIVKLFAEMFTRIVIYPIRSLSKIANDESFQQEVELAKKINIKATRKIAEYRNKDHIFVMFPAGTRYRPWLPETKNGLKETASYINSFDYFCCASINGNNMPPKEHENMVKEQILKDTIVFNYGKINKVKKYIEDFISKNKFENKDDEKQAIVDSVMKKIDMLHNEAEEYRNNL